MKYFPNQKTCYIKYEQKEQAVQAIVAGNGTEIENELMNCNWGVMCSEAEDFFDSEPLKYSGVHNIPLKDGFIVKETIKNNYQNWEN